MMEPSTSFKVAFPGDLLAVPVRLEPGIAATLVACQTPQPECDRGDHSSQVVIFKLKWQGRHILMISLPVPPVRAVCQWASASEHGHWLPASGFAAGQLRTANLNCARRSARDTVSGTGSIRYSAG